MGLGNTGELDSALTTEQGRTNKLRPRKLENVKIIPSPGTSDVIEKWQQARSDEPKEREENRVIGM